jgi:hypothetical protein
MKKLVLLSFLFISKFSYTQYQTVIDTDYPWYSNIIKYKTPTGIGDNIITATSYEIVPVAKNIDFSKQRVFLDDDRMRFVFPEALNKMRKEYNKSKLKHNHTICESIAHCYENQLPEAYPSTYHYAMPAYYGNIVMNFKDKESAICDMFIDFATLTSDDFLEMTDSNAKEFGYYIKKDSNNYYQFIIVIK